MIVTHDSLEATIAKLIEAGGSERSEAEKVSRHLVEANLQGHDSHGVGMVPRYVGNLIEGTLVPNMPVKIERNDGAFVIADGQRGYGQRVAAEAMEVAIDACKSNGLTLLALRNAHHIGRVGTYGQQALDAGLVSLHFVNVTDHGTTVAPFGGSDGRFVTNPICMSMPGTDTQPPLLLDMATSTVAHGKLRVAHNEGKTVADGLVVDSAGQPSNDPGVMFNEPIGAMTTVGRHKGYGLATFCELLAGALTGNGTIQPGNERRGGIVNNMLAVLIDPERLVERAWLEREIEETVKYFKASPAADPARPVMVAGDPERASRAERMSNGVPIDPTTWNDIVEAGAKVGMSADTIGQMIKVLDA